MSNGDDKTSYPMVGGDGPRSYSQNSDYQRGLVDSSKQFISDAIDNNFDFMNQSSDTSITLRIADLGCSVGPNTFFAIQNIIEAIEKKYQNENQTSPTIEYQVFFNDHSDNDFNTLFKNLPPSRKYFVGGVPGSFHGRLFPTSSLHFVHVSNAIHWLSKLPKEVADSESPAWNKDSVYCSGLSKEVVRAYSDQFKNDFESFLSYRAQEVVSGGLMVILVSSQSDGVIFSQTPPGLVYEFFGSCLMEMAKLGLISKEKVESFNIPMYFPLTRELEESIKRNGCFSIEKMETFIHPMNYYVPKMQFLSSLFRAFAEGLVKEHFGAEIVDEIFDYFAQKLEETPFVPEDISYYMSESFILLKRNKC